ncbi:unnamed protein product [Blepharisma stoltei]|uniref:Translation initiation factor eIF2B subunit beta n=1 Tax=Blepharisma stoltei TaxID=1481888 RepID=A0AAU9JKW8_9CILI|nr:unnamed protein product [Blepharisma stoltei]
MDGLPIRFDNFIRFLKRDESGGTSEISEKTAKFVLSLIKEHKFNKEEDVRSLIRLLTRFGRKLVQFKPLEIALVNIVRRALHIIREECSHIKLDTSPLQLKQRRSTLKTLIKGTDSTQESAGLKEMKKRILQDVQELLDELEAHMERIAEQATQHIHSNEVILTFGKSKTVENFLSHVRGNRKFEVLVAEAAPGLQGQLMCKTLAEHGIDTTLIADNSVFALMSRVNKVIIGTDALMANGGLITKSGCYGVCLAAQAHSVPILVTCGLYKLSPLYPFDQDTFNDSLSPALVSCLPGAEESKYLTISVPAFDYIPPDLISLYITDVGGHNPSYLYRLLSEYYSPEDYDLNS